MWLRRFWQQQKMSKIWTGNTKCWWILISLLWVAHMTGLYSSEAKCEAGWMQSSLNRAHMLSWPPLPPPLKPCAELHMIINSSLVLDSPGSGGKVMGWGPWEETKRGSGKKKKKKVYTVVLESETVDVVTRVWSISILLHLSVWWIYG